MKGRERENTHPRNNNREQRIRIVKISITSLSRAHAHTRIPGVFAFLLSQVSQNNSQLTIIQSITAYSQTYFNKHEFQRLKIGRKLDQKSFFSFFRPPKFARFFPPNFPFVWHLWQQKINIAVGRRAYARTWDRGIRRSVILATSPRKTKPQKNILSLFPWFFPLCGHIDPYTDREGNKKQREKKVHPTFGVMALKKAKTAEHFAYLNYHQQMYSYEQRFSISSLGIVSTQLTAWGLPHHSKCRMNPI